MRSAALALLCSMAACTACDGGGGATVPDAASDAPDAPDEAPDANPCGAEVFVTGELLDIDSSTSQLKGVFNARFTLEGMPARTATTAPNGRFELCAPSARALIFDLDAPGAYLDGKAYFETQALGGTLSLRTYTQVAAQMLYAFDPARGHILVWMAGDRGDLSLDRAHDPPLAGNDDNNDGRYTWTPGVAGYYVLFPNVDVSSPTVTLNGDVMGGPHAIPVSAGTLTLVVIYHVFL